MKWKTWIAVVAFFGCGVLSVFGVVALASNSESRVPAESRRVTRQEHDQMVEKLSKMKEEALKERNVLVEQCVDILKTGEYKYGGTFAAIDLLGQVRAIEAADFLLGMADHDRCGVSVGGMCSGSTTIPEVAVQRYPVVKALIQIRPPHQSIIERIRNDDYAVRVRCYVAILIGTQGVELSRYILEKEIEAETDERVSYRLKVALGALNEDFPAKQGREMTRGRGDGGRGEQDGQDIEDIYDI